MRLRLAPAAIVLLAVPAHGQAPLSSAELPVAGMEIYAAKCSFCHDRVPEGTALAALPGVASLALKYGGAVSPYISERPDLANAVVLQSFLRNGSGSMPPFRKTELTDADIAAIAAYFAKTSAETASAAVDR